MVDTGLQHCVALLENGEVWAWGKGNRGQLGDGEMESGNSPVRVKFPVSLLSPPSLLSEDGAKKSKEEFKIKQIAAGFNHSVALSEEGHAIKIELYDTTHTHVQAHASSSRLELGVGAHLHRPAARGQRRLALLVRQQGRPG